MWNELKYAFKVCEARGLAVMTPTRHFSSTTNTDVAVEPVENDTSFDKIKIPQLYNKQQELFELRENIERLAKKIPMLGPLLLRPCQLAALATPGRTNSEEFCATKIFHARRVDFFQSDRVSVEFE